MTYENEILLDWYLLFHYGTGDEILDGCVVSEAQLPSGCLRFPLATVAAAPPGGVGQRALDIGCAVGRSTFELARTYPDVIGIDYSARFVEAAESLRSGESIRYRRYGEMHCPEPLLAEAPAGLPCDRIRFEQGDAMALREDLGSFDLVHAANLLCRLTEPIRFLKRLPALVKNGAYLLLATPATWMEEYTPKNMQPSGATLDYLREHLEESFELESVQEIPFLIREHQRKLQLSASQTSLWRRKS
jgi:putative 4-mercaptohistidine N1-methyltranferase